MKGVCKDCKNREICGKNDVAFCDHYDVPLTRGEVMKMLGDVSQKNPSFIPVILGAIKKTYKINLAY